MGFRDLKKYLMDYFGTAVQNGMIGAMEGLSRTESARTIEDLLNVADMYGLDIDRYLEDEER